MDKQATGGSTHMWVMYQDPWDHWWLGHGAKSLREVEQAAQIEFGQRARRLAVHYDAKEPVYFTSLAELYLHHQAQTPFPDLSDTPMFRWMKRPAPTDLAQSPVLKSGEDKPTLTELADLLDELTTQGMPPRAQARHVAQHYPGMVRKEETE